jgi:hypothetical protein
MTEGFARALAEAQAWVGAVEGIVAVGEGRRGEAPTIDVWMLPGSSRERVPARLSGFEVVVRESDTPVAFDGTS